MQRSDIIDDVILINNSKFGDYVDQIKATEIEMTPRIQLRMFYTIAIHLEIDSDMVKNLKTKEMISILPL